MDREEYKNSVQMKYNKLKRTLSRNLAISVVGLAASFSMLEYNTLTATDLTEQDRVIPITDKTLKELSLTISKMQNIQNAAIGIGGASGLYFIFGLGIPLAGYIKKKKSLEKDLTEKNII
jgi:hypothetical protein